MGNSEESKSNIPNSRLQPVETPQVYGPPKTNNVPCFPQQISHEVPKPPVRRRNTRRKMRTEEEEAEKRRIFLERNRMAAQKCRSRKKRKRCICSANRSVSMRSCRKLRRSLRRMNLVLL